MAFMAAAPAALPGLACDTFAVVADTGDISMPLISTIPPGT